jgi:hypothetical protein
VKKAIIRSFHRADARNAPDNLALWGAQEYLMFTEVFSDYLELDLGDYSP